MSSTPALESAAPGPPPAGPAVRAIVAVNVLVFMAEVALTGNPGQALLAVPADVLVVLGGNDPAHTWSGEAWRLLTAALVHGNLFHVLVNVASLWTLGQDAEPIVGRNKLLATYGITAVVASLASLLDPSAGIRVGASGAAFGLAGVLLVHAFLTRDEAGGHRYLVRLAGVVAANLVMAEAINAAGQGLRLDNRAHVGGLWAGVLCGVAWVGDAGAVRRVVALALLGGTLGAMGPSALRPVGHPAFHVALGEQALDQSDAVSARALATRALQLSPHHPGALVLAYRACAADADGPCAADALEHLLGLEPMPADLSAPGVSVDELVPALLVEGLRALGARDFALAVPLLRRAAELDPGRAMTLNAFAWALVCRGVGSPAEAALALDAADRARRIAGGTEPSITHTYAEALRQAGRKDEALEVIRGLRRAAEGQGNAWWWQSAGTMGAAFLEDEERRMMEGKRLPEP